MIRVLLLLALALMAYPAAALAPRELDSVQFHPVPGVRLPLDVLFVDEQGDAAPLGRYFGARPAIVVLGYYGCSNLCGIVLQGLADALTNAHVRAGVDAEVVVISIAPDEPPAMALAKKRSVLEGALARDADGWHFLTGGAPAIEAVTHALGYAYAYDAPLRQYAHAAGITVAGRDGRVRAMLPGIVYPAATLQAALDDAPAAPSRQAEGPAIWLLCLHYDPHTGRYSFAAMSAVRLAGIAALVALGTFVLRARLRERRRK